MSYGYCPKCGTKGVRRQRRINGDDICENGCVYPSKNALPMPPKASNDTQQKLMPCPFCGGDKLSRLLHLNDRVSVCCHSCTAKAWEEDWNTRADHISDTSKMMWISVDDRLPDEGGRYWCYVRELNDLGFSHYQWNCSWNEFTKVWGVDAGGTVTHWKPLLPPPNV